MKGDSRRVKVPRVYNHLRLPLKKGYSVKTQRFLGAALAILAATGGTSRADLTWEHSGQMRLTKAKQPILKFKIFNNITSTRNRVMMKYMLNPEGMGGMMGGMGNVGPMGGMGGMAKPDMATFAAPSALSRLVFGQIGNTMMANPFEGNVSVVQRFDDDQFLMYSSVDKTYIGESIKELLEKTRFDPWRKLAPKLSNNEPPALTREQRARLGAEVRAALLPFTNRVLKTYLREFPNTRTINGLEGRGYRLTLLINTANPMQGSGRWMRVAMEWWLAGDLPGDEVVVHLRDAALQAVGRERKGSTSMWMNESPRVMLEMLPEEILRSMYTIFPRPDAEPDSAEFKHVATPLAMYLTVSPPDEFKARWGEMRAELNLVRRSLDELSPTIFDAPTGYKRKPMPDINKQFEQMEEAMKGGKMPMPTP